MDTTTLARRLNIRDLVTVYEQSVADIKLCFETIVSPPSPPIPGHAQTTSASAA